LIQNELLLEYKGETFTDKLKDSIQKHLFESRTKELKYENKFLPMALVCVQKNKEIKSLGASIPTDLIMDNFGLLLSVIHRPVLVGLKNFNMTDTGGVLRTFRGFGSNPNSHNNAGARFIGIGKGTTPPTRQDISTEIPFTNGGQEDNVVIYSNGGLNSPLGQVKFSIVLTTTGSGVISESTNFYNGRDTAGVGRTVLWARDLISPTSSFIGGQQVFVEYTWQL